VYHKIFLETNKIQKISSVGNKLFDIGPTPAEAMMFRVVSSMMFYV